MVATHAPKDGNRWLGPLGLRAIVRNLVALPTTTHVQPWLISARSHEPLLAHYRLRLISERVQAASVFLCLATVAWIPIDVVLFDGDRAVVVPLAIGRLVAAMLFWLVSQLDFRSENPDHGAATIALMVIVGVAFILFACTVIIGSHQIYIRSSGFEQYVLMPIALTAGISIFPLSLIEASVLSVLPLLAVIVGSLSCGNAFARLHVDVLILLMSTIMVAAVTSAVSQLNLLINLLEQSTVDPLTDALSRRGGSELLDVLFAHTKGTNTPLSVAMFDLDRFKLVNDRYGHLAGDRVLQELIQSLKAHMRRQDIVIRWGGEEFVLVLPDTGAAEATKVLTRLCFPSLTTRPDGTQQTVSIGLAERIIDTTQSWQKLVEIADQRMYGAKDLGRQQLVGPNMPMP